MALQLLDQWYESEQKKRLESFQVLNQVKDPQIIFLGDSLMEFFPIHELLKSPKRMVNRGILASKTYQVLEHLPDLVFGQKLEKVFILLGTNDLAEERGLEAIVDDLESILHLVQRSHTGLEIYLLSLLPVNEDAKYQSAVYIRKNRQIQSLNQLYQGLASRLPGVTYVDLEAELRDAAGQLDPALTLDGLHLKAAAYLRLAQKLQVYLD